MDVNPRLPTDAVPSGGPHPKDTTMTRSADEPPSSFPRVPDLPPPPLPSTSTADTEAPVRSLKRSKKAPKFEVTAPSAPLGVDPTDPEAVTRANLAAAPVVGVVGYGPGTGGGSGIRRHTPSCDFCKRMLSQL